MDDPVIDDDADALYRPLAGLDPWAAAEVDAGEWDRALLRLEGLRRSDPASSDMLRRGARLAAAQQSGALDGMHAGDPEVALSLLRSASLADLGVELRRHVGANADALSLAAQPGAVSERSIRHVHEVACRPQLMHRVRVSDRVQDHVLAHGEYKHHPNHVLGPDGGWRAHSPVALVGSEMALLVETAATQQFSELHPTVQAAYVLHALSHVAPFADGNGRVARAVAGGLLLRAAGMPLLVLAADAAGYQDALDAAAVGEPARLVHFVLRRGLDLATVVLDLHTAPTDGHVAALETWRRQVQAARALGRLLPGLVQEALYRHRARTDLGWLSPLADAVVVAPSPSDDDGTLEAAPLVIRAALPGGSTVEEALVIDAHPLLDGSSVVLSAEEARLRTEVPLDEPGPAVAARVAPWIDRVVSTLALRVAAELEH